MDLSKIDTLLKKYSDLIQGYAFLLDQENDIIAFPRLDNEPYNSLKDASIKYPQLDIFNTTKHTQNPSDELNYYSLSIENDPFLNDKSFATVYELPDTKWKLGLVIPYSQAFASSQKILQQLFWIALGISILMTLIGYFIIRRIVITPITSISKQMQANRGLHVNDIKLIESTQKGELGTLVTTLNKRTRSLKKRFAEVKALQQEIEDTQKEVVFTMGAIGESRSKETGNHVKRVAEYSRILARYYGLDEHECEMLKQASPMHDIGKVAIPDAILNKPGRFDPEERLIMDTHATLGYEMLKYSNRPLLKMAATVAYEHHEKYDGSGYPQGTKGEAIHIYGRITALADVFDALGSDRVYKKAWDDERIFSLFREERGKHFDPKLIDIFFEHLDEFLEIREQFKDIME
jgi:response regulator RpfG family c-di-GMP phosphodiesterase